MSARLDDLTRGTRVRYNARIGWPFADQEHHEAVGVVAGTSPDPRWPVTVVFGDGEDTLCHPNELTIVTDDEWAPRLVELRAVTGMSWDQLATYFGVSPRAVHLWTLGGRMSETQEAKVAGHEPAPIAEAEDEGGQVVDLLEALARSVDRAKAAAGTVREVVDAARASRSSRDTDINRSPESEGGES